jgi:hypothetical protein
MSASDIRVQAERAVESGNGWWTAETGRGKGAVESGNGNRCARSGNVYGFQTAIFFVSNKYRSRMSINNTFSSGHHAIDGATMRHIEVPLSTSYSSAPFVSTPKAKRLTSRIYKSK